MATITEDYVSYEVAKLLKEKGFNEPCVTQYDKRRNFEYGLGVRNSDLVDNAYKAPTLQMAMKYLLITHHLLITTFSSSQESWMFRITKPHQRLEDGVYGEDYETREEACEAAINYCLENLIKK